jgi:hypothetical protein
MPRPTPPLNLPAGPTPCCCCRTNWALIGQTRCGTCSADDHGDGPCLAGMDGLQRFASTLDELNDCVSRWRRRDYGGRAGA